MDQCYQVLKSVVFPLERIIKSFLNLKTFNISPTSAGSNRFVFVGTSKFGLYTGTQVSLLLRSGGAFVDDIILVGRTTGVLRKAIIYPNKAAK
jgi:hypothetical protein